MPDIKLVIPFKGQKQSLLSGIFVKFYIEVM